MIDEIKSDVERLRAIRFGWSAIIAMIVASIATIAVYDHFSIYHKAVPTIVVAYTFCLAIYAKREMWSSFIFWLLVFILFLFHILFFIYVPFQIQRRALALSVVMGVADFYVILLILNIIKRFVPIKDQ